MAAAMTRGQILLKDAPKEHMEAPLELALRQMGVSCEDKAEGLLVQAKDLKPFHIATAPYPGFPTDLQGTDHDLDDNDIGLLGGHGKYL